MFPQELHRKREEKRRDNERMAEEEMAMLKESGKVGRSRKGNVVRKKTRAKVARDGSSSDGETEQLAATSGGGSRACNIDDLFQVRFVIVDNRNNCCGAIIYIYHTEKKILALLLHANTSQ